MEAAIRCTPKFERRGFWNFFVLWMRAFSLGPRGLVILPVCVIYLTVWLNTIWPARVATVDANIVVSHKTEPWKVEWRLFINKEWKYEWMLYLGGRQSRTFQYHYEQCAFHGKVECALSISSWTLEIPYSGETGMKENAYCPLCIAKHLLNVYRPILGSKNTILVYKLEAGTFCN